MFFSIWADIVCRVESRSGHSRGRASRTDNKRQESRQIRNLGPTDPAREAGFLLVDPEVSMNQTFGPTLFLGQNCWPGRRSRGRPRAIPHRRRRPGDHEIVVPTVLVQAGRKDWLALPSWHILPSPKREESIGAPRMARPCILQAGYVNYSRPPGLPR
jgi:hypothetical protein